MGSFGGRFLAWLGIGEEDEYEEYEDESLEGAVGAQPAPALVSRGAVRNGSGPEPELGSGSTSIRTLNRDLRDDLAAEQRTSVLRQVSPEKPTVHVIVPGDFGSAQEIADRLKEGQPVIVNLQAAERDLARRMIDFCSGATYALSGKMEKAAEQVFLLSPSDVQVSAEERQRLSDRGFYQRQ